MVLIGYWPLNESSGSTVFDHCGRGLNGSVNGSVSKLTGIFGQTVYSFDGSNGNNLETPSFDPYTDDATTLTCWIKSDTHYTSPSTNKWFINHHSDSSNRLGGFIGTSGNLKGYLKISGNVTSAEMNGNPLNTGEWNFISIRASNGTLELFVNGVKKASSTFSGDLSSIGSGKLCERVQRR